MGGYVMIGETPPNRTTNPRVAGSNPARRTRNFKPLGPFGPGGFFLFFWAARSLLVKNERNGYFQK
ncbi:MAG: hypothetical protein D3909_02320 [Candidatus Electrothrix sp. ATG1]|nr:hypothetical protein [Candidatus Electrothrix sp. ATG1]